MINKDALNDEYKQNLEESIIDYLAKIKKIEIREAMDIYNRIKLNVKVVMELINVKVCFRILLKGRPLGYENICRC